MQTAQSELAHVTRVTSMSELMASIAPRNQSAASRDWRLTGTPCQRWLAGATPNLEEGARGGGSNDQRRESDRAWPDQEIRAFVKKSPPQKVTV